MSNVSCIRSEIYEYIQNLLENKSLPVSETTPLVGGNSVLDSMKLVELCLLLEDRANELGAEFDWTSDTAMSKSRSMFRTAGALADEFILQLEGKK